MTTFGYILLCASLTTLAFISGWWMGAQNMMTSKRFRQYIIAEFLTAKFAEYIKEKQEAAGETNE